MYGGIMKVKVISVGRVTKYAVDAKIINERINIHKEERIQFMEEMVEGAVFDNSGPYQMKVDPRKGMLTSAALLKEFENYFVRVLTRKHGVKKAQKRAAKIVKTIADNTERKPFVEFSPEVNPAYKVEEILA
jgi:hypothetical protein